jgi:hypothetical protein
MPSNVLRRLVTGALPAAVLTALLGMSTSGAAPYAVPRAVCGPGSLPETGLQGQVPKQDRDSGRSALGYRCNLELVGQYRGQGTSWVSASLGRCAYLPQAFPSGLTATERGVRVVDAEDPAHPRLSTTLTSPAMLGNPWESLKTNEARHLLGGVMGGALEGAAFFDLYDVADCTRPRLLSSTPTSNLGLPGNLLGHEGAFSPDGMTYWSSAGLPGMLTALDVADPARPRVLTMQYLSEVGHGLSLSPDGRTLYFSSINPNGVVVLDVSEVQERRPEPQLRVLSSLTWSDGQNAQHTVPVSKGKQRYVYAVDEMASGAVRLIDVTDPARPHQVSRLLLEIHLPENAAARAADLVGTGAFGYDAHYCEVDRQADPRLLACGFFNSGVRVFDVRDLLRPREVAYYNPPAQTGKQAELVGSEHASGVAAHGGPQVALTADWCSSAPRFVGRDQLWVACQDNGFLVLRLTNRA